jgi:hypothetical protein
MDEESTGGIGFDQKLPAHRLEFHPRNGIPRGITRSWKPIQTRKIKMREKSAKYQFNEIRKDTKTFNIFFFLFIILIKNSEELNFDLSG